jgi:O-antigen ligase
MLVLLPIMSSRVRLMVCGMGVALLGVVFVTVPGMLGTIVGLFTGISDDSSAASRTDSYSFAGEFIVNSPYLGRGFFTFLPEYRILDNQYLGTLIELGVVGLFALLCLFTTGLRTAWVARQRSQDPNSRQLNQALMASLAAGAVSFAFFDAFAFPMVAALMFLLLGMVGASHRLAGQVPTGRPLGENEDRAAVRRRSRANG